jgi:hypothetical protein
MVNNDYYTLGIIKYLIFTVIIFTVAQKKKQEKRLKTRTKRKEKYKLLIQKPGCFHGYTGLDLALIITFAW